jgi:hypothetical protein
MEQTKLFPYNSQGSVNFGTSVSISGDYAIVGAMDDDSAGPLAGSVYIFHRIATNTWDTGTKIISPDVQDGSGFGNSVSISGDYVVIGSYKEDVDSLEDCGAAYFFRRTGTNHWLFQTKVAAPYKHELAEFGNSVSISGDYAIVGSHKHFNWGPNQGMAFIFHRTEQDVWLYEATLDYSGPADNAMFGNSVSINGDYAIVGAHQRINGGAAYIFKREQVAGSWDEMYIWPSGLGEYDNFGSAVSISGDYAAVGNDQTHVDGTDAVYIYHRTDTNRWDDVTVIDFPGLDYAAFGRSVSISGDILIIGDRQDSSMGSYAGAVYIYRRIGINTWDSGTKITAFDAAFNDQFGESVSIDGLAVIVGAIRHESVGAAYVY